MATRPADPATQSHTIQLALAAALSRDVAKVWPNLDRKRLDATFPTWLQMMVALVERYHGMSSMAASVFYDDARAAQAGAPAPDGLVKLAPAPSQEWMKNAFSYSGPTLLRDGAWQDSSALSTTQGTAVRLAQSGGRETIIAATKADPDAVGYYRVTDGSPCAFCALLASRGVVYKKASSFDRSNSQFEGAGKFKVHNDCGCTVAPAFSKDQALPDISAQALKVYRKATAHSTERDVLPAFRKAWREHLAAQAAPDVAA